MSDIRKLRGEGKDGAHFLSSESFRCSRGLLERGETMENFAKRHEQDLDGAKPGWGDHQKMYEALGPEGPQLMSDEPGVPIGEERTARRKDGIAWLRGKV